jgi:hypothetical protein
MNTIMVVRKAAMASIAAAAVLRAAHMDMF